MMLKYIIFCLTLIVTSNQKVMAQCIANQNNVYSFTYNGNLYKIVKESQDWLYAQSCADNEGGYLAQIDSQDENDSIFKYVNLAGINASSTVAPDGGNASYLWIGGSDISVEGQWNWSPYGGTAVPFWQGTGATGSAVGGLYNNWGSSINGTEPDNYNNNQNGLAFAYTDWPIGVAGQWNDVAHTNALYYIIEYDGNPLGINDVKTDVPFHFYPNPCTTTLTISLPNTIKFSTDSQIKIYNLLGLEVKTIGLNANKETINTQDLANGVYFIKIESEGVSKMMKKFIVSH